MMNVLPKTYICDCGCEKEIKWVEPLRFYMGYAKGCYGNSSCPDCGKKQSHYSGSPDCLIIDHSQ